MTLIPYYFNPCMGFLKPIALKWVFPTAVYALKYELHNRIDAVFNDKYAKFNIQDVIFIIKD